MIHVFVTKKSIYYLYRGGYVFIGVSLFVSKIMQKLHKSRWRGGTWAMEVCLFVCLGFNGTFSTNRLYRTTTVG